MQRRVLAPPNILSIMKQNLEGVAAPNPSKVCVCVCLVDLDPDRLHHVGLTLVNQTTCRDKWGGGLISESHICSHPAGSPSCMVTAPSNSRTFTLPSVKALTILNQLII